MGTVRIASWNVWWRFGEDWRSRERGIVSTLANLGPDAVGLQEVWSTSSTSQADVLAERLGMHAAFAAPSLPPPPDPPETPDQDGVELGVAVLSRWPITEAAPYRLPTTHRTQGPVALVATIEHPSGPLHLVSAAVEWASELADDHIAQTRALTDLVRDPSLDGPLPVLLTADLNAPPHSPQVRPLAQVMVDTWTAAGGDLETVTLSSRNPLAPTEARQIDQRIDYVLARPGASRRPVVARRAFIAGDQPHGDQYPSDHFATVADHDL